VREKRKRKMGLVSNGSAVKEEEKRTWKGKSPIAGMAALRYSRGRRKDTF